MNFRYLHYFSRYPFSGKLDLGQYDVFGDHVFYQRDFFSEYFPKQNSFYVATIREPFDRLESHLKCFRYLSAENRRFLYDFTLYWKCC